MPSGINSYAFCADYSDVADCLSAIQVSEQTGIFEEDAEALRLLGLFENDVLKKLYLRTIRVLGIINGDITDLLGDFEDADFSYMDFHVGYRYDGTVGIGTTFKTILIIFRELCSRSSEITEADKLSIDAALIPVLDAFTRLKKYLESVGLNPCDATESAQLKNSKGVYLQVAGSDNTNNIAPGLHLRWTFTDELGENHLPKGAYNNSGAVTGFNKPNDYVKIFRTPYVNPVRIEIDFETSIPVVDSNGKVWTYLQNQTINEVEISNRIRLTFTNAGAYDQLAASVNPATASFNFLKQYTGIVELEPVGKSIFTVGFDFKNANASATAALKIEALSPGISYGPLDEDGPDMISTRKTVVAAASASVTAVVKAENVEKIRVKKSVGSFLQGFYMESYYDFLATRGLGAWTEVGNGFSLSLDNIQVYSRLETAAYAVNNLWPQYNNGTKVKVQNYRDKWEVSTVSEPCIKDAVTQYLSLSNTDPRAEITIKEDSNPDDLGLKISYLDILNMQATDYHLARMLGLGHIDVISGISNTDKFVYQLRYENRKGLTDPELIDYTYTSLPTAKQDLLLPQKPAIRELTYSLPLSDGQINTIFDEQGYANWDDIRIVNIGRELFPDEIVGHDFFENLLSVENLNIFEHPKPVLFGVEYRPENQVAYVKPEITQEKIMGKVYYAYDPDFPVTGVPESVPVPDNESSLFIHQEKSPGIHYYAIYGINWFSRASAISDEVVTDETIFPLTNSLTPPTDLTVQYIQKEEQILFTTEREQDWLSGRATAFPGGDIYLTRITFNWIDIADVSKFETPVGAVLEGIVKPDKANIFFRSSMPAQVAGVIKNINPVEGSDIRLKVSLGSYQMMDGTTVAPSIFGGSSTFENSLLVTPEGQFRVVGIQGSEIIIEQSYETTTISEPEPEVDPVTGQVPAVLHSVQKTFNTPRIGSRFTMVENLSNPDNWSQLTEDIAIISFADANDPVIETAIDVEGNISKFWIGGINAQASVAPEGVVAGCYKITFGSNILPPHPQVNIPFDPSHPARNSPGALHEAHVEWYKGWVRMPVLEEDADPKQLEVQIISQESALVLYVYDPSYMHNPIQTGSVMVNFHPGYRAYLFSEPSGLFNMSNILPADNENERKTLIGVQLADERSEGSGFSSTVSLPAVLMARNIQEPMQMPEPLYIKLKVRPDATGKAAFTFDVRVPKGSGGSLRKPFGFMFYRTTPDDMLDGIPPMPLMEQVPIYDFIKEGRQTENVLPLIRDMDGNLLNPTDPNFNPFPNVRKYSANNETYIRFTDYTLNGSSRDSYFYTAAEVTNQLVSGELSTPIGPVTILHSVPPDPLVVRTYIIQLPAGAEDNISVRFQLAPISEAEDISRVRIYRTTDAQKALSIDTMEIAGEDIDIEQGVMMGYDIVDTFEDLEVIPLGRTVYYRLLGIRTMSNESDLDEDVYSYPSEVTSVRLIDTKNPVAPSIDYNGLLNKLSWEPTTYNGTYYLYKQNTKGNWEKIYTVLPPDSSELMEYILPAPLVLVDGDGNNIYYRFKVEVENSGGLFNVVDNIKTVGNGI